MNSKISCHFLQAAMQRTRAMSFLKAIFEDGVDCILTPGEVTFFIVKGIFLCEKCGSRQQIRNIRFVLLE